jgi:ParB-like chromosome segregation protein Spo0J
MSNNQGELFEQFGSFKTHPVLDLLPLTEGAEFAAMVEDIQIFGLIDPIVLAPDGQTIIDGRVRYLACRKAGVEPRFRKLGSHYDGYDVIQFIISANVIRTHLTADQRALLEAECEEDLSAARGQVND